MKAGSQEGDPHSTGLSRLGLLPAANPLKCWKDRGGWFSPAGELTHLFARSAAKGLEYSRNRKVRVATSRYLLLLLPLTRMLFP